MTDDSAPIDLITGGAGLTGRALVDRLLSAGRRVRTLDLVPHPDPRVESVVGDVCDPEAARAACDGVDTVFHTVAIVSQHPRHVPQMERVNVDGTATMLGAGRDAGARAFVFTSSIDVVFSGQAIAGGDESLPYADRFLDDYGRTKAEAERLVLAADDEGGMRTVALRAAGIFGPHDRNRFPVILEHVARWGFTPMGSGSAQFSHVYVENVAHAHVLAARALGPGSPAAGNAYFVTDHAPSNFFDFIEPYLDEFGYRRARFAIPEPLAWWAGRLVELAYHFLGRFIAVAPVITRYTVAATCRDFWFEHDGARRDFGYEPVVSASDAFDRTLAWLREYHAADASEEAIPRAAVPST